MNVISYDRARLLFTHRNGKLYWRATKGSRAQQGTEAGWTAGGYRHVCVDGKNFKVHRIIFLLQHGYLPENDVDHEDQDPGNNHPSNLRELSHLCNMRNAKQRASSSNVKGISWSKHRRQWRAHITATGRTSHLGYFDCIVEAACHRLAAEQALDWYGCETTSPALRIVRAHLNGEL